MEPTRKFKIIVNSKECGTCSGPTPSAVAKKVVKKLCGNSSKAVRFSLKECKRGCERVCGPYQGRMEKLDNPYKRDGNTITHRVVCGKVKKMRGGRDLKVLDFEKVDNRDFRPEGYGFFKIPYIYFGDIKKIYDKNYYELVIFNKEHLGNEIGIESCDGNYVHDVREITDDIKNKLKQLLTELENTPNKYKRIQSFIKDKIKNIRERGSERGRGSESERGRGNVFNKLLKIYIKKYTFDNEMIRLLKNNNNINLKYEKGYVFFGNRNGMYRYIISPNQTYIPINDSEYIVLEELKHSNDKKKQNLYSEIMEDIKRTVSEISKENRTSIIANITKNNPNLLFHANTILS